MDRTNGPNTEKDRSPGTYRNQSRNLVSLVGYLLGVPERIFEADDVLKMELYEKYSADLRARVIRNLCILRTMTIRYHADIHRAMHYEYKGLASMPEHILPESLQQLSEDGVIIGNGGFSLHQILIKINGLISDRINNCKDLFPLWVKWDYMRRIFIMPDGLTETGFKAARSLFYNNKDCYPYRMYLNWEPADEGNILYNDEKFMKLLYQWNNDAFTDTSRVLDAKDTVKGNIYEFIAASKKTVLVVDCENSDPYKLYATLRSLNVNLLGKISKIILFDDIRTSTAWDILNEYFSIPIECILIDRVKSNKSLVDIRLTAGTCREFFQNQTDSFILVSSDSDYWGLISAVPDARFLVMLESKKSSSAITDALKDSDIIYCYIDDFYSGDNDDMKLEAIIREANKRLIQSVDININQLLEVCLQTTRVDLSEDEKKRIVSQYLKRMQMEITTDGSVKLRITMKK